MLWGGWGERKRERARFLFLSIIDILMRIPSGSLCGGESERLERANFLEAFPSLSYETPPPPRGGGSYVPLLLMSKVNFLFFDSKAVALELQKLSCLILYLTVWKQYASTIVEDIRKQKDALLDLNHSHITR